MSTSRFTRLISYLKEQEDQIRAELTRVDTAMRHVEEDIHHLSLLVADAAQTDSYQQRQQLLTFTAPLCR